ncbi:hypothetical protein BH23ACT7_BH23ACT7_04880 [soil metagenome]
MDREERVLHKLADWRTRGGPRRLDRWTAEHPRSGPIALTAVHSRAALERWPQRAGGNVPPA